MREDSEQKNYISKNLSICAFLYASNLKLVKTTRLNGEVYFEWSPKDKAEKLVESYFAGTASCNPRDLMARLNDLRDLIFQGGSSHE